MKDYKEMYNEALNDTNIYTRDMGQFNLQYCNREICESRGTDRQG